MYLGAKVQISEDNTKGKTQIYLFFPSLSCNFAAQNL